MSGTDVREPICQRRRMRGWALAGLCGLLSAGAALGAGELAAAAVRPQSSPVVAVGARLIALAPEKVKEFAIGHFGEYDKSVLLAGIYATLAAIAVVVGLLAAYRRWAGIAGFTLFGTVGAVAAVGGPADAIPSLVSAAVGAGVLVLLIDATHTDQLTGSTRPPYGVPPHATAPPGRIDRRRLLLAGTAALALAVGGVLGGRALQAVRFAAERSRALVRLPRPASPARPVPGGVQLDVPGISRWRTTTSGFYRVDTALSVPQLPVDAWRLRIHGMVAHPLTLTFDQLVRRPLIERDITLTCVSDQVGGPYVGNARWLGAPLADLLRQAGIHPDANQLISRSVDGMTIGTPTASVLDGRDAMLAVGMNGRPLPVQHGFPVRMVVPGLYGYVSACKWIVDIEATTFAAYDAYWTARGYATHAPVRTESRIDTPRSFATVAAGTVVVAGVAWAQRRGITGVHVQVDGGPWRPAQLATAASADTWRQWLYHWQATRGSHTLRARATDTTGTTQTPRRTDPYPDGASGWHTVPVTVT